jgi:hypothetical protein
MFQAAYGDPAITAERIAFAIANYERTLISDQSPLDQDLNDSQPLAAEYQPGLALFNGTANCSACHTLPFASDLSFHNIGLRPDAEDIGLEATTGSPLDRAKFKTPIVRNVAQRLPLFHNGQADTIEELVDFYDGGGDFDSEGNLDANMEPLNLTEQEKADLILFLEVATLDPRVANNEFPFTRPTLASELPSKNSAFGISSANGLGVLPEVITHVPANIGHPSWLLGLHEATPNATTIAAFSFASDDGSPFPDPRYPIPMNIDVGSLFLLLPGTTDGLGVDTVKLSIPLNAVLTGMTFYVQWFVQDPAALATGGVYGSEGIEVEIF